MQFRLMRFLVLVYGVAAGMFWKYLLALLLVLLK